MRISDWSSDVCSSDLISIDYAIMERAGNLSVVPYDSGWSDLGGWDAVWSHAGPDAAGVTVGGGATAIDCSDTLLRSDSDGMELVGLGLSNIIAGLGRASGRERGCKDGVGLGGRRNIKK